MSKNGFRWLLNAKIGLQLHAAAYVQHSGYFAAYSINWNSMPQIAHLWDMGVEVIIKILGNANCLNAVLPQIDAYLQLQ